MSKHIQKKLFSTNEILLILEVKFNKFLIVKKSKKLFKYISFLMLYYIIIISVLNFFFINFNLNSPNIINVTYIIFYCKIKSIIHNKRFKIKKIKQFISIIPLKCNSSKID